MIEELISKELYNLGAFAVLIIFYAYDKLLINKKIMSVIEQNNSLLAEIKTIMTKCNK
jgi:hypothetical protein